MADRYCPSCGTEVDADARFCPSCGITLEDEAQPALPPAPAWPEPQATRVDPEAQRAEATQLADERVRAPEPAPVAAVGAPPRLQPAQPARVASEPAHEGIDLPFTWPTTASGWLIGAGSVLGAIALIPSLGNLLSVLLLLALLGVAASVFLAERLPMVPRLRLITLLVTTIGLGIALDRATFAVRGPETILLVAMVAAAGGALLIELDRDRPIPPAGRSGG